MCKYITSHSMKMNIRIRSQKNQIQSFVNYVVLDIVVKLNNNKSSLLIGSGGKIQMNFIISSKNELIQCLTNKRMKSQLIDLF